MNQGTNHFISEDAAVSYYEPYGYDDPRAAVRRKIEEGEIAIGMPPVPDGHRAVLHPEEGRYFIEPDPNAEALARRDIKRLLRSRGVAVPAAISGNLEALRALLSESL